MKKTIFVLAVVLVFGLTFYIAESKAEHPMGPEFTGPGYGSVAKATGPERLLTENEARTMFENYIKSTGNPDLRLGRIEDIGVSFKGEILNKGDSVVDEILLNKKTGGMRSSC
jgi:hypothetical protein